MLKAIINFFKRLFGLMEDKTPVVDLRGPELEEMPAKPSTAKITGFGLKGFRYPEPEGVNYTVKNGIRNYLDGSTYNEATKILSYPDGSKYDANTFVLTYADGSSLAPCGEYFQGQLLGRIQGWKFNIGEHILAPQYGKTAPLWLPVTKPIYYDGPGAFGGGSAKK